MFRIRLDWLIVAVIFLASLSFIASIFLLIDPWRFTQDLGVRANVSQSASTALALVLGTIAIIISVSVERSEYRAQESIRHDIAVLAAALHSTILKTAYATQKKEGAVSFERERQVIGEFLCSTTAFSFICWTAEKSKKASERGYVSEGWRVFLYNLAVIQGSDDANMPREIMLCVNDLLSSFETLNNQDLKQLSRYVHNLDRAIPFYKTANNDSIVQPIRELSQSLHDDLDVQLPSNEIIDKVLVAAEQKSPGLAIELKDTLQSARQGDKDSILLFLKVAEILIPSLTIDPENPTSQSDPGDTDKRD